jgi:hypothetical protein
MSRAYDSRTVLATRSGHGRRLRRRHRGPALPPQRCDRSRLPRRRQSQALRSRRRQDPRETACAPSTASTSRGSAMRNPASSVRRPPQVVVRSKPTRARPYLPISTRVRTPDRAISHGTAYQAATRWSCFSSFREARHTWSVRSARAAKCSLVRDILPACPRGTSPGFHRLPTGRA